MNYSHVKNTSDYTSELFSSIFGSDVLLNWESFHEWFGEKGVFQ